MRTVFILGVAWFVAADVCRVLGHSNPTRALESLDQDEVNTLTNPQGIPGNPNMNVISESGLYALILRSRKPAAVKFRKWVTAEVLPALRRDGYYALRHASAANPIEEKSLRSALGALVPIKINHWNANSSALQFGLQCIGSTGSNRNKSLEHKFQCIGICAAVYCSGIAVHWDGIAMAPAPQRRLNLASHPFAELHRRRLARAQDRRIEAAFGNPGLDVSPTPVTALNIAEGGHFILIEVGDRL